MRIDGSAVLHAPLDRVYPALADPAVLVRAIPGCEALEVTGPDDYRVTVRAGVASITGVYLGTVRLTDQDPPHRYTLHAAGQGGPGTVEAVARIELHATDDGCTRLEYSADAVIGGVIAGVGQRVLAAVARRTAGEFFAAVELALAAPDGGPAAEPVAGPLAGGPTVFRAAPAGPSPGVGRPDPRLLGASALFGASIALVGVALGARLAGRAGRGRTLR